MERKSTEFFAANSNEINISGRYHIIENSTIQFAYPGVTLRFGFSGRDLYIHFQDLTDGLIQADGAPQGNFFNVYIDNHQPFVLELKQNCSVYKLADNLQDTIHQVKIIKRTEAFVGSVNFLGISLNKGGNLLPADYKPALNLLFIGNSITCGYGVEAESENEPFTSRTENVTKAYAVLTANALNANYSIVAYSGKGLAYNYDGSQQNTLPVIWNRTIPDQKNSEWNHKNYTPDAVCINLGTNDFYSGKVDTSIFRKTYKAFITEVRNTYPQAQIVVILGPMMNNNDSLNSYDSAKEILITSVDDLKNNGFKRIHFFELSQQTGEYSYGAGKHPSEMQQLVNARELTIFLKSIL